MPKTSKQATTIHASVAAGRSTFFFCLAVVAISLGLAAHYSLSRSEDKLALKQFEGIARRALDTALELSQRKRLGSISVTTVVSYANPSPERWPRVYVPGFHRIASNVMETSTGQGMAFVPLVRPDELVDFEEFAYDLYEASSFPNGTGVSSFGRGVWVAGDRNEEHVRETGSDGRLLAPILQHSNGADDFLMLNLASRRTQGDVIQDIIDCSNVRATTGDKRECGTITDFVFVENEQDPSGIVIQPIYPAEDEEKLVGFIASSIVWSNVLVNVFADGVNGIDCVIASGTRKFTYRIQNGKPILKGEGDLHVRRYSEYERDIQLTPPGMYSISGSANYTLSVYPSSGFFVSYTTMNPIIATIGAFGIIFLTSIMFFLYDYYVRKEFTAKTELINAKRKFVRFVSHEVRTPLNSVCMGLTLIQEELQLAIEKNGGSVTESTLASESGSDSEADDRSVSAKEQRGSGFRLTTQSTRGKAHRHPNPAVGWLSLTKSIYDNAQSSVGVLNDLLNYDRIEVDRLHLELTVIPIWSLIESTVAEFNLPAAKKRIDLLIRYGEAKSETNNSDQLNPDIRLRKAVGDTIRISQVLRNLLSNAIKFQKGGNIIIQVSWNDDRHVQSGTRVGDDSYMFTLKGGRELSCKESGYLRVQVSDSGAGMTKDQLSKLFRNGVQFNKNELQSGNGSGLGLYIAKGIMDQHGGTLSASSGGLGKGTTFTMRLPLFDVPGDEESGIFATDQATDQSLSSLHPLPDISSATSSSPFQLLLQTSRDEPQSPLHILIVDDAPSNRKLLQRILERQGHHCDIAENGKIAVDMVHTSIAQNHAYDAILLDFEMPVMNGPTAASNIRRLGCDSFIVGITGNVLPEDIELFKQSGANGVLPKPFKLDLLNQLWMEHAIIEHRSIVATSH